MIKFSERVSLERQKKGVTQGEVAEYLGIKIRAYQYYESGGRRPDFEGMVALANYFNVTTDYLLGRTDKRT